MEDVKDFHDTHDSLSNWLAAKERMMTVLGPISSDSRMVQNQVQQVQVQLVLNFDLETILKLKKAGKLMVMELLSFRFWAFMLPWKINS